MNVWMRLVSGVAGRVAFGHHFRCRISIFPSSLSHRLTIEDAATPAEASRRIRDAHETKATLEMAEQERSDSERS
jgi:hypothetical protein